MPSILHLRQNLRKDIARFCRSAAQVRRGDVNQRLLTPLEMMNIRPE